MKHVKPLPEKPHPNEGQNDALSLPLGVCHFDFPPTSVNRSFVVFASNHLKNTSRNDHC